ncbi:hypothetical protein GF389_00380 [Candidatus Dojkabacteria bacterium]|nr:hypothetical protein [Candidatus Dojkabacteria bacterium]
MKDLRRTIRLVEDTYKKHFHKLGDRKLHFASRLYSWCGDPFAKKQLEKIRSDFLPKKKELLQIKLEELAQVNDHKNNTNGYDLRKPYLERIPGLKRNSKLLYYALVADKLFDTNIIKEVTPLLSDAEKELDYVYTNPKSLSILSTYAINPIYLYNLYFLGNQEELPIHYILRTGKTQYNPNNNTHIELLIYLFTHCIIGETLFFTRKITKRRQYYKEMLAYLENVITQHYENIHLDNKFEFLVCTKIMDYSTTLFERITEEATKSVTSDGYIIDQVNKHPQKNKTSFAKSEHRNVLFLMANRPFIKNQKK